MSPMRRTLTLLLCLVLAGLSAPLHAVRQPLRAKHGMVVTMEATAADVGVAVLEKGGNAVDAAVAVGFAMAVTHPFAGNLGGGGYMLIRMADGRATFIDFRERAPEKASRNMYLDDQGAMTKDSTEGWRSSGVPGTVRGFEIAVNKYGKRKWAENLAPAVELASKGFPVSYSLAEGLKGSRSLASSPESKRIFQRNGSFYEIGEKLVQPELAQTLERIAKNGANEFYEGETATRFAGEMAKNGGIITLSDLKSYKAIERTPLTGKYQELHDHHLAALELRRHRAARDARHPRRHRLRKGRRRLGLGHPLSGRGDAPRLCRPQRVRRRSRLREGADRRAARSRVSLEAARVDRSGARHAERRGQARQAGRQRKHGDHPLLGRRRARATRWR